MVQTEKQYCLLFFKMTVKTELNIMHIQAQAHMCIYIRHSLQQQITNQDLRRQKIAAQSGKPGRSIFLEKEMS